MDSSDARLDVDPGNQLLEEHRRVSSLIQGLRRTRDLELLLAHLIELQHRLREHFAREEEPTGFFAAVRASAPRHDGFLCTLAEEHVAMLADLDALAAKARQCLHGPVADVLTAAAALGRRLRRHERSENDLLMQAFLTDLGTGD